MAISTRTYHDFSFNFSHNPMSGDVAKKAGAAAVKSAMLSIMKTNYNERLFQPEVGSGLKNLLFEQMSDLTAQLLEDEVRSAIDAWENRAQIISIEVFPEEEYNRYRVAVIFRIVNDPKEQQTEVLLSRER